MGGSGLNLLMAELRKRGIVSKARTLKSDKTAGGIPFTQRRQSLLWHSGRSQWSIALQPLPSRL
jgi:hypothetical protein